MSRMSRSFELFGTLFCLGPLVTPQRNFWPVGLPSLDQHALPSILPIEVHGYYRTRYRYRTHGSGHSRLALRADFLV